MCIYMLQICIKHLPKITIHAMKHSNQKFCLSVTGRSSEGCVLAGKRPRFRKCHRLLLQPSFAWSDKDTEKQRWDQRCTIKATGFKETAQQFPPHVCGLTLSPHITCSTGCLLFSGRTTEHCLTCRGPFQSMGSQLVNTILPT